MSLPVDFVDAILNDDMGGKRRFNMITNSDGTVSFVDATTYDQEGSTYGASQVNAVGENVNQLEANFGDVETGDTAAYAHTKGSIIIWKKVSYEVTAAIAVDDTLAVETNLTKKTVSDLNSDLNPSSYTTLFSTQTSLTAQNTTKTIAISGLSNYHKILIVATVGDGYGYFVDIVDRIGSVGNVLPVNNASITSGFVAQCIISVDWEVDSISITGQTAGWAITTIHLDGVYGIY